MNVLPYKDFLPKLGKDVLITRGAWVIGEVEIGDRSSVWFNSVVRGDENYIKIGCDSNIQDNCTLHGTPEKYPLIIGDRVTVGHGAILHGCIIEDDCLIGMGAIVMDGSTIGKGSLVAAGAILTPGTTVPPGSLVMGAPAQVKRPLNDAERQRMIMSMTNYGQLTADYRGAEPTEDEKRVRGFLG
jgi:carbonic anhydrase/acetyltransferase-like protein (isoleucine patch superfamily)